MINNYPNYYCTCLPVIIPREGGSMMIVRKRAQSLLVCLFIVVTALTACDGRSGRGGNLTVATAYSVSGTVSGLRGTFVVQNNKADDLTITTNGQFTFITGLSAGSSYAVTVLSNPIGQLCLVSNGSGTIFSANITNVSVSCVNRGELDPAFNTPKGYLIQGDTAGGNSDNFGNAVAIDPNGRIIVTGSSVNSAGGVDLVVWRFNRDGSLDDTFNGSGLVTRNSSSSNDASDNGKSVALDSHGKIVVAGSSRLNGGNTDMMIWRFNEDGTVDMSFNASGHVRHDNAAGGNGDDIGNAIVIDNQERIVVAGYSKNSSGDFDLVVWRYNPNGTVDTGLNGDGIIVLNSAAGGNGDDMGDAITIDANNRIVVAGSSLNAASFTDMVVLRFKSDGALDTIFNTSGIVDLPAPSGSTFNAVANGIAIDSQGRIVVTGSGENGSGNIDMLVWRFKADGSLDSDFNGNGIVISNGAAGSNGNDTGNGIALSRDGGIYITGSSVNFTGDKDMVIWALTSDGSPIEDFGSYGHFVHNSAAGGNGDDTGIAVVLKADGRLVAAGSSQNNAGNFDMAVWQLLP
jgi:uncharacterized delta-60 repeat protein